MAVPRKLSVVDTTVFPIPPFLVGQAELRRQGAPS